jgi:hypothetical protein
MGGRGGIGKGNLHVALSVEDAKSAMALRAPPWKSASTGLTLVARPHGWGRTRLERPDILPQSSPMTARTVTTIPRRAVRQNDRYRVELATSAAGRSRRVNRQPFAFSWIFSDEEGRKAARVATA